MKILMQILKYLLIIFGIVIFIIYRRFFLENQKLIMGILYSFVVISFLLGTILLVLQKRIDYYIENDEFEKGIKFSKKFGFYSNLSQSFILGILMAALNRSRYDFVYNNIKELNLQKGKHWRYFIEIIYFSLLEEQDKVESSFLLLIDSKIKDNKPKYIDEIIRICSYIKDTNVMTDDFYIKNVKSSSIVGERVVTNSLLRKCFKLI